MYTHLNIIWSGYLDKAVTIFMCSDNTRKDSSVIELTQQCSCTKDPVLDWLLCGQFDGQDIVGGMTRGGQSPAPSARLVQRGNIRASLLDILFFG